MWLPSTPIHHPGLPATAHGRGYADPTRMTVVPLATSRWRVWTWVVGLLLTMAWSQRVQAQATITIHKKAQSETAGQQFGFTSTIPGGLNFNLTDNGTYIPVQDVGVGNNNRVWVTSKPASGIDGFVYFRTQGNTNWTGTTIFANRLDADQNGTAYIVNSIGDIYSTPDGVNLTRLGGPNFVDVGASAGASQFVYALGGSGACKDLYFYNGAGFVQVPGACGTRLDVAPDGTVWVVYNGTIYHLSISGTSFTIIADYAGNYGDVTVAADGTVWALSLAQTLHRLVGGVFVTDPNAEFNGGISAGSDGDAPFTIHVDRLFQRNEDITFIDDHTVNTVNANTVSFNVAPGTYTVTENSPPSSWQLSNIVTAGGSSTKDLPSRTATVTVLAGQTAYVEFDNVFTNATPISNSCGSPFIETFGTSGTTAYTFGPALPNGYTSYHYLASGLPAGHYGLVNQENHTPGDPNGYMMTINGGFGPDEFFRRRFSGLVPGATYYLSLYAKSISNAPIKPNIILEARRTDGTLLTSFTSGDITFDFLWHKYQLELVADASGTVDFIVRNNQQVIGTGGNDIALDDITVGVGCDFGDAPNTYLTTVASNGASHKATANLKMGALLDIETDGIAGTGTGDDADNTDDEDGVAFGTLCTGNTSFSAIIANVTNTVAPSARLIGWVDFNRNGTFEPSEGATIAAGSSGSYTLTWTGLSGLVAGTTYARIRLTSDAAVSVNTPGGAANDGEVEDYQIIINPGGGTITASATSLTTCSGDLVSINYTTSPAGQTVRWVRMPGNVTALGSVSEALSATGTTPTSYTYSAIIADIYGCLSNVATTIVTVNPVPVITPSVCSQTICSGETGAITFVSSVSATINWLRVEDGATGTGNISQLFATAGTNTYKIWGVSAAPASCPSSTTITCVIVVNQCTDPCSLTVTASASSTAVCVGQVVTLASTVTGNLGAVTYAWIGPNGFTSNAANPTLPAATSATAGTYSVFVSDPTASTSCVQTASVNISVGSLSVYASSNSPVCTTGSLSLTGLASGGTGPYTYAWSGPNGFVSAVQNPTVALSTTAQSGSYTLVALDTQGCSGVTTTAVVVAAQPTLAITGSPSLTICSGQSTTLNVGGSNGAPVSWTNSLGQTGTGTTITSGTLVNAGTGPLVVTYRILAQTGSCSDEEIVQVVVNPEPHLRVVPNASVICNLEQTNVTATAYPATASITWTRTPNTPNPPAASGSGTGSVTINQVLPPATYIYTFTATNGGCSSTLPATVAITVQQ
ncbi:GEVED domain-containing protein [Larkinella sp. GY13]|uniref:GEVED domain-containing protein n=1 Tax=Larkinella sp. GY13 TaxID=3453720 RepID=UPI003EECDD13